MARIFPLSKRASSKILFFLLIILPFTSQVAFGYGRTHGYITVKAFEIWPGTGDRSENKEFIENGYPDPEKNQTNNKLYLRLMNHQSFENEYQGSTVLEGVVEEDGGKRSGGIDTELPKVGKLILKEWVDHFWDPMNNKTMSPKDPLIFASNILTNEPPQDYCLTAFEKAAFWFTLAIITYKEGNNPLGYYYLGRTAHLLQDMAVPAHVNQDVHVVNQDEYEKWADRNFMSFREFKKLERLKISDSDLIHEIDTNEVEEGNLQIFFSRIKQKLFNFSKLSYVRESSESLGHIQILFQGFRKISDKLSRKELDEKTLSASLKMVKVLFYNLARASQYFPSDDSDKTLEGANLNAVRGSPFPPFVVRGKWERIESLRTVINSQTSQSTPAVILDPDENKLFTIAQHLIPRAIQFTAALYELFYNSTNGSSKAIYPPIPYQDHGACPFEGCTYGEWIAKKDIVSFKDQEKRSPVAFTVKKGEKVTATTGTVITTKPGKARVLKEFQLGVTQARPGDIVYLLTYQGEGVFVIWFNGKIYKDLGLDPFANLEIIENPVSIWWVKVKNSKGEMGWSDEPANFDGKDRFGGGPSENLKPVVSKEEILATRGHVELVPARSTLLLDVDYGTVRQYPDLLALLNLDNVAADLTGIGLQPNHLSKLTVFGEIGLNSSSQNYFGAVLETTVDLNRILGKKFPRDQIQKLSGSNDQICILGDRTFAIGTHEALSDIIKTKTLRKGGLVSSGKNKMILNNLLNKKTPIIIFMSLPQKLIDMGHAGLEATKFLLNIANLGVVGQILAKIGIVESFGMSITQKGASFPTELLCSMESEKAASFVSGSLNLLKSLALSLPTDKMTEEDKQMRESFANMRFSREKKVLTIGMAIPRSEFLGRR